MKTGKLLQLDIHPNLRTPLEHKAFLSTLCRTFMHTKKKSFLCKHTQEFSCTNSTRRNIPCDVCDKKHIQEPKQPMVCDWNHLSLSVAGLAGLASERDRGLELT